MISECSITMLLIGPCAMGGEELPKRFYLSSHLILGSTRPRSSNMTHSNVDLSGLASLERVSSISDKNFRHLAHNS